jgi:hypothetical protein
MKDLHQLINGFLIGFGTALLLMSYVQAHPCGSDYEPECRTVSYVDPISGNVEYQRVCD